MTTSFKLLDVGFFENADIYSENIAMKGSFSVSTFGYRFSEESHLFESKDLNILEGDDNDWDEQIKVDFLSGKFNQLIKKAREEFAQGKAIEI